jgi:hypothetical protein
LTSKEILHSPLPDRSYQCWVVFLARGVKQPAQTVGAPVPARAARQGTTVTDTLKLPPDADACDLAVREHDVPNPAQLGELSNVALQGKVAPPKLVALSAVRVEKVDGDTVRVAVDYEFTSPPDAGKFYTLMVQRADVKDKNALGYVVVQAPGPRWQMKGQVVQNVGRLNFGTARQYRVWMADGANPLDATNRVSTVKVVTAGGK